MPGDPAGRATGAASGHSKLDRHDVKAIEAKGKPFDPREHDAISQVPSADVAPGPC